MHLSQSLIEDQIGIKKNLETNYQDNFIVKTFYTNSKQENRGHPVS